MAKVVNELLQDGRVLFGAATKYAARLADAGVTAEEIAGLKTLLDSLAGKDTDQKETAKTIRAKTKEQDAVMKHAEACIKKIRTAAKAVFRGDNVTLKEFHIGVNIPKAVNAMATELKYMKAAAEKYKTNLAKRGIKDADIAKLGTCFDDLGAADTIQENVKKLSKAATNARNATLKQLDDAMYQIRTAAAIEFEDEPDILEEFKSIIKKKSSSKTKSTDAAASAQTQTK